jgi:hypothetical protein
MKRLDVVLFLACLGIKLNTAAGYSILVEGSALMGAIHLGLGAFAFR